MSSTLNESVVEEAALDWLGGLGFEVLSGPVIAQGETAAELAYYKQVCFWTQNDHFLTSECGLKPQLHRL